MNNENCGQIRVMVLGVYHMGNAGRHVVESEVDDVHTPRRQQEIEILVKNLAKWEPDIVAVEFPADKEDELNALYKEYVKGLRAYDREDESGSILSSRNEVVQIGFRLAQHLNHEKLLAIDWFPEFPDWITEEIIKDVMYYKPRFFFPLVNEQDFSAPLPTSPHASRGGRRGEGNFSNTLAFDPEKILEEDRRKLKELSISRYLYWLNSEPRINLNDAVMVSIALEHNNRKAAFTIVSNWFERNLGIVRNLKESLPAGKRRVLLMYGAGHVPMLKYILGISPLFCPVSPLPYLTENT